MPAAVVAELPEVLGALVARVALRRAATAGAAAFREGYEADKRRAAAEREEQARARAQAERKRVAALAERRAAAQRAAEQASRPAPSRGPSPG